jgi:hypothetical protein
VLKTPSSERGQAIAETALFMMLAVMMAWGILALIPFHRARTAAISAAYGCAQFLAQSPGSPERAAQNATRVAYATLDSHWSATRGVSFRVEVLPPQTPGGAGSCQVRYQVPVMFMSSYLKGVTSSQRFISRSELWKAKWR